MKTIFIISLLIAAAYSANTYANSKDAQVLRYDNDNTANGYNFAYETSDGIARQETAELRNAGTDEEVLAVRGSYSFIAADGQQYVVNYIADENGFQPEGGHLPS